MVVGLLSSKMFLNEQGNTISIEQPCQGAAILAFTATALL